MLLRLVGPVVDGLYPKGFRLFETRLSEVLDGRARCTLAVARGYVVGVAVETPKGARRMKLSTLWVHPLWRNRRIGTALLQYVSKTWHLADLDRIHLTVSLNEYSGIFALLHQFGFRHLAIERDRYGEGRHEAVLVWTPDSHLPIPSRAISGAANIHLPGANVLSVAA